MENSGRVYGWVVANEWQYDGKQRPGVCSACRVHRLAPGGRPETLLVRLGQPMVPHHSVKNISGKTFYCESEKYLII